MTFEELIYERQLLISELNTIPYKGSVLVIHNESGDYIRVRQYIDGHRVTTYVGKYSPELYTTLLKETKRAREINVRLKQIDKELLSLGYMSASPSEEVLVNIDFARRHMVDLIYDQAVLEGVSATYVQTQTIIENARVNGVSATDVAKVLNLKHAWDFILDPDVIMAKTDYAILTHLADIINETFYYRGGQLRTVPVSISGTSYVPSFPLEVDIKDYFSNLENNNLSIVDRAIEVCLYIMKGQFFIDGNKRVAVVFANHYLIKHAGGLLAIPNNKVNQFRKLLIDYYEGDETTIKQFMRDNCVIPLHG